MNQIYALLAFAIAAFSPLLLVELPSTLEFLLVGFVMGGIALWLRQNWLLWAALGFVYALCHSEDVRQRLVPEEFRHQNLVVSGRITDLPRWDGQIWRMALIPDNMVVAGKPLDRKYLPGKLRLSFYGHLENPLVPGEQIQARVTLQRPRGLANPGLFDYQRWLIGQGFHGSGYIKTLLKRQSPETGQALIDRWRYNLVEKIQEAGIPSGSIISALLVGDRQHIPAEQMSLLANTGTIHLMAISGLHVGFVAAIGFFLGRWLCALLMLVLATIPNLAYQAFNPLRWAAICSMLLATSYSAAAGFSTPTVRALVMLCAFLLPRFFYLKTNRWWGLSLALALVSIVEPLAPLQTGFWLSFAAVVLIFLAVDPTRPFHPVMGLIRLQVVFLVGFSATVILVQGQVNLVSLPANLIAVPITGFLVVPLAMLGLLVFYLVPEYGLLIWTGTGQLISGEMKLLHLLHEYAGYQIVKAANPLLLMVISALAGLALFALKAYWQRLLALLCMLPAFVSINFPSRGAEWLELRAFDVGQGLAILVRQPDYSLLYDTGPKFSESFDSGAHILAPSLTQLGIGQLDDLVISHPDADHLGGYEGLTKTLRAENAWLGRQHSHKPIAGADECMLGTHWQNGGVAYDFLYPNRPDQNNNEKSNNRSCVLQITWGEHSILIPGDIDASVEHRLLDTSVLNENLSLIIAPHHGSKTSSSRKLIEATQPKSVIFSSGYQNRFNHPHPDVVARYERAGSEIYSTATDGMIRFFWASPHSEPLIETHRGERLFWWQK